MSIPEVFFRETIDLNRYSNAVSADFVRTYNDVILLAARKLNAINIRQAKAGEGVVIAPQTKKRLRAIIAQSKSSLDKWSKTTTKKMIKEIEGLAKVQAGIDGRCEERGSHLGRASRDSIQSEYSVKNDLSYPIISYLSIDKRITTPRMVDLKMVHYQEFCSCQYL